MRPVDADKLLDDIKAAKECGGMGAIVAGTLRRYVMRQPTLTPQNEALICEFDVVDTKTGEYPDLEEIALTEEWAKGLMYCDMDGFAIREDGSLILLDECGNCVSCPQDRFEIRRPPERQEDINA